MGNSHLLAGALVCVSQMAYAHGDVAPQPMNTDDLPEIGEEWLVENPYRMMGEDVWSAAVTLGDSGYNQNCPLSNRKRRKGWLMNRQLLG